MRTINNARGEQMRVPTYRISAPYDGTENPPELMLAIEKIMADLRAQMTPQQAKEDPFLRAIAADHLFVEEVQRVPERFSLKNMTARVREEGADMDLNFFRVSYDLRRVEDVLSTFGFVFPNAQLNEAGQMTFKDEAKYPAIRRSLISDCGRPTNSGFQIFRPNGSKMLFFVPVSVLDMQPAMPYLQTEQEIALFRKALDEFKEGVEHARMREMNDPVPRSF